MYSQLILVVLQTHTEIKKRRNSEVRLCGPAVPCSYAVNLRHRAKLIFFKAAHEKNTINKQDNTFPLFSAGVGFILWS